MHSKFITDGLMEDKSSSLCFILPLSLVPCISSFSIFLQSQIYLKISMATHYLPNLHKWPQAFVVFQTIHDSPKVYASQKIAGIFLIFALASVAEVTSFSPKYVICLFHIIQSCYLVTKLSTRLNFSASLSTNIVSAHKWNVSRIDVSLLPLVISQKTDMSKPQLQTCRQEQYPREVVLEEECRAGGWSLDQQQS